MSRSSDRGGRQQHALAAPAPRAANTNGATRFTRSPAPTPSVCVLLPPAVLWIALRSCLCIFTRDRVQFDGNPCCRAEGALSSSANARHRRLKRECPVPLRRPQASALCVCRPAALLAYGTRRLAAKHERRLSHRSDAREKLLEARSDPPRRLDHSEIGDTARLR